MYECIWVGLELKKKKSKTIELLNNWAMEQFLLKEKR